MKKVLYRIPAVFQLLLLIAAFAIQELSMKRMGMMRYVVYINHQLEAQYPIISLRDYTVWFMSLLSIAVIAYVLVNKRNCLTSMKCMSILLEEVVIIFAFVFFVVTYSTESCRSYYFISFILAIVLLIQDIKTIMYLK